MLRLRQAHSALDKLAATLCCRKDGPVRHLYEPVSSSRPVMEARERMLLVRASLVDGEG
jgi:hypothetical protein